MIPLGIGFVMGSLIGPLLWAFALEGYERICKRIFSRKRYF